MFARKYCAKCMVVQSLMDKLSATNSTITQLKNENDRMKTLLRFNNKKESIINIVNFKSELFIITYNQTIDFRGRIKEFEYNGYSIHSKNDFRERPTIKMYCSTRYNRELDYLDGIFIDDFICDKDNQNRGYGSIIMKTLIKYAKELNVNYISGELSFVDIGTSENDTKHRNNRERLYHFYPKFGFVIQEKNFANGGSIKTIRLNLNDRK